MSQVRSPLVPFVKYQGGKIKGRRIKNHEVRNLFLNRLWLLLFNHSTHEKNSRIRETLNLLTDADRINIAITRKNLLGGSIFFFFFLQSKFFLSCFLKGSNIFVLFGGNFFFSGQKFFFEGVQK